MSSTSPGAIEPEQLNASLDSVSYEVDDRLALITLDRPEKMNSLSVHLQDEFQLAIKAADA